MRNEASIEVEEPGAARKTAPGTTRFAITGMTCGNCARHVTEAIQRVPGVRSATVSLEGQSVVVRWDAGAERSEPAIVRAVEGAGFGAKAVPPQAEEGCGCEPKLAGWRLTLWIAVLGTAPLMIGEWGFGLAMQPWFQWVSFGLAGIVQVFAGARFYRGAWSQLKAGDSNMDTLVSLGSTTAFGYSTWALLSGAGGHLYFMEAAAIITLISVGHWVESRVSARAADALRRLLRLAPELARRRNADGTETEVPVAELRAGEAVVLRPGERVPTDGEATEGDSAVDESMLTGESAPVDKRAGSKLYAGTLNLDGRLVIRVTATGEETALAHIIAAVQQAQSSRAQIQRLADRVSNVFVPIVVAVAVGAGLWWGLAPETARRVHETLAPYLWAAHPMHSGAAAFIVAAAVLIVACPCAMGLATPAAIMAGANAAARHGILIRDGVAMERAGQISAVLFDKTGTLTAGKPEVAESWVGGKEEKTRPEAILVQRIAASLAENSSHPVSRAVAKVSPDRVPLGDWQEIRGCGVQGKVEPDGATVRLGSLRWLQGAKVDLAPGKQFIETWSSQGATVVGLAGGGTLRGLFAVRDTLKPGARRVVEQLQRQGLETYLVTGDNALTASSIAAAAGIDPQNVFAEVRPEAKAELVKQLQQKGKRVAFVGDGINDAPAIEQADLGIAVSQASDIAREAADIILLKSEIEAVPESLALARATLRTIKQNLFWAFFYNAIGIPLAALGFLSPVLCAAAMGLSDLVVIGNALRLGRRSMSRH
jgi:Cu+-exporting ATPase